MDPVFLAIAFVLGFTARQIGLPPLVGFLAAGFALNGLGFESGSLLGQFADLGVTLLLFSIGLKLKIETLLKPEVWAGASLHMVTIVVVFGLAIFALAAAAVHLFADLDLASSALIAFALSFSSTVFAVKALEENSEIFYTLKEAQIVIEQWRRHHNTIRPHSALGWKPPAPEAIVRMDQRPLMH